MNKKWLFLRRLYLCKCGMCFKNRIHFNIHLKNTKRYRKYHYASDYKEIPFTIFEYTYRKVKQWQMKKNLKLQKLNKQKFVK